ncbi:polysaccharide deacetylase family protein [Sphaerisporangium corydalis]|uniref:Polysaccharide deacetylase family protein n=1 Tax=Sphaerisporangium corydalis TaxID=1441875 RepID=A0ABV9EH27_9ACTN|nr:polysaccharide deacetylase family protein [Sphaerisporangium corydalis]
MPHPLLSGGIALLLAVASGCGIVLPLPLTNAPTTLPAQPTTINFVPPSTVDGLTVRTITDDSAVRHIYAGHPELPSAPALTKRLAEVNAAAVRRFSRDAPAARPGTASTELNVGWQLTAASAGVYGVRLRTGSFTGGRWSNSLSTFWYDQTARRVHDSTGLLRDAAALGTLASIVRDRLRDLGQGTRVEAVKPTGALFDSLNFNPHGDLVAEFDDGQVAPERMGRVAVAVPTADATPLLSDFGRRAMAAVDSATPSSMPGSPPPGFTPGPQPTHEGPVDCAAARCVALTFDDGPGPDTGALLDALARYGARATFFTLGASAEAQPALMRRMAAARHLVAGHAWSHRDLATLDVRQISDELSRTQIAIGATTGRTPPLMRAPYGGVTPQVAESARALGLAIIGWSVDAADARDPDPASVARRATAGVRPGSIVLMHDGGHATVAALPRILTALAARGYVFVTVPELYGPHGMEPGQVHNVGSATPAP